MTPVLITDCGREGLWPRGECRVWVEVRMWGTSVRVLCGPGGKWPRWRWGRRWRIGWRGVLVVVVVVVGEDIAGNEAGGELW